MTSETEPRTAFVWIWLPNATDPVVAGRLDQRDREITFTYGTSYLDLPNSIPIYLPELPLERGAHLPLAGTGLPLCISDAAPDAWGRRVINHRLSSGVSDYQELTYLLESGSDRIGALDFQTSPTEYNARTSAESTLVELTDAAALIESGESLTPLLELALLHGSSVGGARPKALLADGPRRLIAKFSSSQDTYPQVKAEFVAMELARRVGLDAAAVEYSNVAGRDVLLVERFDRAAGGTRRLMVSSLTILGLDEFPGGRYASYTDLADQIRSRFADADKTLRELFGRIVFNILCGNTDDHGKNHAAFFDGSTLTLTPAYDICPQHRSGEIAGQAMAFGLGGVRDSKLIHCIEAAGIYHLHADEAREIIDTQVAMIKSSWDEVCDVAQLPAAQREAFIGRQFLNPYIFYDI
jgi:serine/threonine-protein kinase HipA